MPGQMLHGQLSLGYLLCDRYGPTNLPLKFMEAGVSKTTCPAVGWVGGWVGGWLGGWVARQNGYKA